MHRSKHNNMQSVIFSFWSLAALDFEFSLMYLLEATNRYLSSPKSPNIDFPQYFLVSAD